MTQNVVLKLNRFGAPAPAPEVTIYMHPEDVANDPKLSLAQKREILASWISDARAVENAPALRRLDSGAVVEVDAISRALMSLEKSSSVPGVDRRRRQPRGEGVVLKWLSRTKPKSNDDDDDPPPAPAGFGVPFRPTSVGARAAPTEGSRRLAYATG